MSMQRRCDIYKATDGKWYMTLGNREYAYEDCDCTEYGPFDDEEGCDAELLNHANPGGLSIDNSGECSPPENPVKPRRSFWY